MAKPKALLEVHIFEKEADCTVSSFCVELHLASALQASSAFRLVPWQTSNDISLQDSGAMQADMQLAPRPLLSIILCIQKD